ncbi:MAG: geranylgeranylglycerol-phosphate geranylgeranyltransferase [Ignavibacteria bacterium]|nr:geranylgeranylglycerol-phosphate geranylgeranyltransferase [Ignavibacteria bacterium]
MLLNSLFNLIKLTRPLNGVIAFVSICVAVFISSENGTTISIYLLAALSGAITGAAGNVINDIYDVEIDKINRPDRVLVSGKVGTRLAVIFYFLLVTTSLLLSYIISIQNLLIVLGATILVFIYSKYFKRLPLAGNLIVATVTGFAFIYGGVAAGNYSENIFPALFAFMTTLIREIVKDIEDMEGDSSFFVNSFPIAYGITKAKRLILSLTILLIIMTTLPFILKIYNIEFFIVIMLILNPFLVYSLKLLFNSDSKVEMRKVSSILKAVMIIGLIAIVLGL